MRLDKLLSTQSGTMINPAEIHNYHKGSSVDRWAKSLKDRDCVLIAQQPTEDEISILSEMLKTTVIATRVKMAEVDPSPFHYLRKLDDCVKSVDEDAESVAEQSSEREDSQNCSKVLSEDGPAGGEAIQSDDTVTHVTYEKMPMYDNIKTAAEMMEKHKLKLRQKISSVAFQTDFRNILDVVQGELENATPTMRHAQMISLKTWKLDNDLVLRSYCVSVIPYILTKKGYTDVTCSYRSDRLNISYAFPPLLDEFMKDFAAGRIVTFV